MNLDEKQTAVVLAAAAAQMRSALSNIRLAASRLAPAQAREKSASLDRNAAVLDQACYQLLRLMNNFADAAYLYGGKELHRRECDLAKLVHEVCAGIVDLAEDKGLHLSYSLPAERCPAYVDPDAVQQVLYQLLSNAVKFTPAGGTVRVALRVMDDQVVLSVSDTGCGIADDIKDTILTRYLQPGAASPPHGFGLGLPLCSCIAEAHGGRMFWQSEEGRGSQFFISLPARPPKDKIVLRDIPYDMTGGHNAALLGLADALDLRAYSIRSQ